MTTVNRGLVETIALLRRMMAGERLTLSMLEGAGAERAAMRRRLRSLVEGLPHAHRAAPGRGRAEEFWWTWPTEQQVTPDKVVSLAAARAMLHSFREGEVGRVLAELLSEHLGRLPESSTVGPGAMDRMFYASSRLVNPLGLDVDVLDRVTKAVTGQHVLRARYAPFDRPEVDVRVEPWTVLFADEGVYVYGMCLQSHDPDHIQRRRIYNLARLSSVRVEKERFAYPHADEYDPATEFARCFGVFLPPDDGSVEVVVLRFSSRWRRYLQHHRVHGTQTGDALEREDGRIDVTLRLYVTYDLVRWIRGHGEEVEVVTPAALARWVDSRKGPDAREAFFP